MGRPELADCLFRMNQDRTMGQFLYLDLLAGTGAEFLPARITTTPERIQRKRTKGWSKGSAVIVSRPSRWGNPCKVGVMQEMGYHDPHAAAAENFQRWLAGARFVAPTDEADRRRERILTDLHLLRGKDLACTCPPARVCHADVLLHRANMPAVELQEWIRGVRARVDWHRVNDGDSPLHPIP
jgi:hypothetical protein